MKIFQNVARKTAVFAMAGLAYSLTAGAETRIEWQLLRSIDDIVNSSLTQISKDFHVVLVSDNGPYALSRNNYSNRGVAAVEVELNEDKSQVINPSEEAIFIVRLDENRNNLISVDLMALDGGHLVNNSNLAISKSVPMEGDGWLFSTSSSLPEGVYYIEQRPMDQYRYVCLKDGGKRFNSDELIAGEAEMRVYLKQEVTVDPIDPDPIEPDPVKPDAPTFTLGDGVEADENGWVDLSSVDKEVVVTLEAPAGCSVWYCLAYDGNGEEPDFVKYTEPIHVEYAGELAFYSENSEGVKSEPVSLLFNGYTVTTGIDTVNVEANESECRYDIYGRQVRPGYKGIVITPNRKMISL